ncbi:hypothetical protein T03_9185 [Trichinella britovi]|uniref:Uncharacterized protein n=1 Tax=Trichinella britovi TaxID=45882 RepID=A0A0V1DEQ7_TRIBR|nr:hypothetical protein T03_9185 [Trichinella britovi]
MGYDMIRYVLLAEVTENTICKHRLEKSTASSVDIVTLVAAHSLMDNQILFHLISSEDHKYTMSAYLRLCLKHQRD